MRIIEITAQSNGAHKNQTLNRFIQPPAGWAIIPPDMAIPSTYPFVDIEVEGGVVVSMTAGVVPEPEPEPEPEPTVDERVTALEAENKLLKEQVKMQSQQQTFLEDCLLEIGDVVYA